MARLQDLPDTEVNGQTEISVEDDNDKDKVVNADSEDDHHRNRCDLCSPRSFWLQEVSFTPARCRG